MICCNIKTQYVLNMQHVAKMHHIKLLEKPQTGSKQAVFLFA